MYIVDRDHAENFCENLRRACEAWHYIITASHHCVATSDELIDVSYMTFVLVVGSYFYKPLLLNMHDEFARCLNCRVSYVIGGYKYLGMRKSVVSRPRHAASSSHSTLCDSRCTTASNALCTGEFEVTAKFIATMSNLVDFEGSQNSERVLICVMPSL